MPINKNKPICERSCGDCNERIKRRNASEEDAGEECVCIEWEWMMRDFDILSFRLLSTKADALSTVSVRTD